MLHYSLMCVYFWYLDAPPAGGRRACFVVLFRAAFAVRRSSFSLLVWQSRSSMHTNRKLANTQVISLHVCRCAALASRRRAAAPAPRRLFRLRVCVCVLRNNVRRSRSREMSAPEKKEQHGGRHWWLAVCISGGCARRAQPRHDGEMRVDDVRSLIDVFVRECVCAPRDRIADPARCDASRSSSRWRGYFAPQICLITHFACKHTSRRGRVIK